MFIINMTPMKWENYKVGVPKKKKYKLLLNSDDVQFGGQGMEVPAEITSVKENCDYRVYSLTLDVPPYSALIFVF